MKATELREMTDVELNKQLKDLKAELFNLRFQHAINPVSYTHLRPDPSAHRQGGRHDPARCPQVQGQP